MRISQFFLFAALVFTAASCQKANDQFNPDLVDKEEYLDALYGNEEFISQVDALQDQFREEALALQELEGMRRTAGSEGDEPFVFFIIGDSELDMRGNTYEQLSALIDNINNVESLDLEFATGDFEEGESKKITKPELLFLAGDICKDRGFGLFDATGPRVVQLFNELDDDILFFPGNGNHDWDPYQFGDGSYGHNFGGLISNIGTANFVRSNFTKSLNKSTEVSDNTFNYDRGTTFFPLTSSAEFNYSFSYKGLIFTNLSSYLHTPVAMVSFASITSSGPAWYFENRSSQWFSEVCQRSAAEGKQHVVIQHYPVRTGDSWWNDDLGSTPDELRKEYLDIFSQSHEPVMFSGHNHSFSTTNVLPYGITDYTAGYFAQQSAVIAVKASASKGIYAISFVRFDNNSSLDPSVFSVNYTVD